MTTAPSRLLISPQRSPFRYAGMRFLTLLSLAIAIGCSQPAPIETYTIPTKIPEQLRAGKERMLAAMFPKGETVWFFKVTGPEPAIAEIDKTFRRFVEEIEFADDVPDLTSLPEGWRRGANKEFRFASIDVDTPDKQLDVSISQLPRQEDWDEQAKMNVNRWRGQLKLPPSDEKWASGEEFQVAAADTGGIWVDLLGDPDGASGRMSPPFANAMSDHPPIPGSAVASADRGPTVASTDPGPSPAAANDERLKFDRPEGWRDGRMTSMRMAAFSMGPEDSAAELTVIPAGGDLRGNVARWLGQVRGGEAPADVVDKAMAEAQSLEVDGRPAQRFFLAGEDATAGEAIDATIIPLENGMSLFVKMTGPAQTVTEQADAIASFLKSLELNL